MNNLFFRFLLIIAFTLPLMSCEKKPEDYTKEINKAIEKGEYMKAYSLIDEMKIKYKYDDPDSFFLPDWKKAAYDESLKLEEKIIKNEIADAIESSNGSENVAKVVFIIEERGSNSTDYYIYAIKLAQMSGNEDMVFELENAQTKAEK